MDPRSHPETIRHFDRSERFPYQVASTWSDIAYRNVLPLLFMNLHRCLTGNGRF